MEVKKTMDLEKKLDTIQGCLKKTDNKGDFEQCVKPMNMQEVRESLEELKNMLE
jgi:hypothetical protein